MPQKPASEIKLGRRLGGIDILRGLALFFVLMNHVNMRLRMAKVPYTAALPDQLVSSLVWNGQQGVQIFFAVSGFLITSTALKRWGSLSSVRIRDFWLLRFARIAPLLLALLVILSGLDLAHLKNFIINPKVGGLGQALLAALTFRVNVLEAAKGYLPANWDILWSLSVEEAFYFFFPILCRTRILVFLLPIFVILGPISRTHGNAVWREYSYFGGMDAIALGCLTALLMSRLRFAPSAFLAIGAPIMIFSLCFTLHAPQWGLDMTILAIGTCMVIAASAQSEWRAPRIFAPLLSLGQRSYEVYLTHMFVVFACFEIFLRIGKPTALAWPLFAVTILAAGILGAVVAAFYSEPANRKIRSVSIAGRLRSQSLSALDTSQSNRPTEEPQN